MNHQHNGLEVHIERTPLGTLEIYFIDRRGGRLRVAQPVNLIFEEMQPGEAPKHGPTLRLYDDWGEELLQAFAESLDKRNIKTDKDAKIEGTLEATRFHLEDLRRLLKLRPKEDREQT